MINNHPRFGARLVGLFLVGAVPVMTLIGRAQALGGGAQSVAIRTAAESAPRVDPAVDGVLDLFQQKSVVALGDAHGLAQEEAFYSALIRDPRFAAEVGNVVVEFGGEASQGIIDRYVAGEDVPPTELRRVWTETVGWIPGPTSLGYVNFFASVRAANLKLPPEQRIKVWLGDPKIDWSTINSLRDLAPYLARRDDNFFRIIDDEILKKHKKTLLIIGTAHLFGPRGPGPLSAKIEEAYPRRLAIVSPFLGYVEPECNAKVVARAKDWSVPAVVGPVEGTWLKSELELKGCSYFSSVVFFGPSSKSQDSKNQKKSMSMPAPAPGKQELGPGQPLGVPGKQGLGPGEPAPSDDGMAENKMVSGVASDAILYLGPPDTLTQSPVDPNIYLDADYFKEESRRAQCCKPLAAPLDWDQILQQNSVIPRKFELNAH